MAKARNDGSRAAQNGISKRMSSELRIQDAEELAAAAGEPMPCCR